MSQFICCVVCRVFENFVHYRQKRNNERDEARGCTETEVERGVREMGIITEDNASSSYVSGQCNALVHFFDSCRRSSSSSSSPSCERTYKSN